MQEVVGVVDSWEDFLHAESRTLRPPMRRHLDVVPRGQRSPRAGSMGPSQAAIGRCALGFHTARGGINPRDHRSHPRGVGVVEY